MSKKTNRQYIAKLWSSDGSGIVMKLRVGSGVKGFRFEEIEPLKHDANKLEKEWYNKHIEPLLKKRMK